MASAEFKDFMAKGAMTIHPLKAQEFTDFVKQDTELLGKLIK